MDRIDKLLANTGRWSRKEAEQLIRSGRVTVDGRPGETGMKVCPGQKVCIGKKVISRQEEMVVLAVNKPVGIVCTEERRERGSIIRYLDYPVRVTYIGRLDKDSRGLLLMTNNGDIINQIMRSANRHEKEYKVTVDREVTRDFLDRMAAGVPILDTVTRPCLEVYVFDHPDSGHEPADPQDVRSPGIPGEGSVAHKNIKYQAGKPERRGVPTGHGRRTQ